MAASQNIQAFGTRIRAIFSQTFPQGIDLIELADDTDGLDSPSIAIAETARGVNGTPLDWTKAVMIPKNISVVPSSDADKNLQIVARANMPRQGIRQVRDIVSFTVIYPDGSTEILLNGRMTEAPLGNSLASSGRKKSKTYKFMFADIGGSGS